MSVYNERLDELKNSISSILNQTYHNIELIIVNDNPHSLNNIKYLMKLKEKDNRIRLFFNQSNSGQIFSRNKGMQLAYGEYIALMDADDIAKKNRLNIQMSFLKDNNLDAVCSNFSTFDDNKIIKENCYSNKTQFNQNKIKKLMSFCNIALGPTLFFKKSILKNIYGYRKMLVEDYDLAVRLLVYGYRLGYQSSSLIYKKDRLNSLSRKYSLKEFVVIDSISKYLRKYNFNKIVPLELINLSLNKISINDEIKYNKFSYNYRKLKDKFYLSCFIKVILYVLSSKIVFKRSLWILLVNRRQDFFLQ